MLVLSRKVGETIVIGGQVLVTVRNVRSKSVSLGIMAPRMFLLIEAKSTFESTPKAARWAKEIPARATVKSARLADRHPAVGC